MKAPRPKPPTDLPPGTAQIGGPIDWFSISLGLRGESLVPEEVSRTLAREANDAWQKDKALYRADGTLKRIPKFGAWFAKLKREDTDEWDCCEAIAELLRTLPSDPAVWRHLAQKYSISLSVGLDLESSGCGFELSPDVMVYLGERQISAGFSIYYDEDELG